MKELTVTGGPTAAAAAAAAAAGGGPRTLVAKAVDAPRGAASDVGHQRKLRSYAVEVR